LFFGRIAAWVAGSSRSQKDERLVSVPSLT
jgi:hypothetical protein